MKLPTLWHKTSEGDISRKIADILYYLLLICTWAAGILVIFILSLPVHDHDEGQD